MTPPSSFRRLGEALLVVLVLAAPVACREFAVDAAPEVDEPVPGDVAAELGVPFRLGLGELGRLEELDLGVRLLEITEDSRCPLGTDCPTAGQVGATFRVERDGFAPVVFQLWVPGLVNEPWLRGDVFQSESERFRLLWVAPYPEPGIEVPDDSLRALLRVDHGI